MIALALAAACGVYGRSGGRFEHAPAVARYNMQAQDLERQPAGMNTEQYAHVVENEFLAVADHPLSTFSIDVDTASYANVRRFLREGPRPPIDAVRIEELINYFDYDYAPPTDGRPFAVHTEVAAAPWAPSHKLVRVALKGREIADSAMPPRNLVFLIDVSGSMSDNNKLPLLREAFKLLVEQLTEKDRVAIVLYAGSSGVALPPTPGDNHQKIIEAIDELEAGGSTNGAEGIELAYQLAVESYNPRGINRVILATDGDFNVGVTDQGSLIRLIEEKREQGVFLTVLGFGMGNYKDATMESLADKGNGNYAYIDTLHEAKKVLVTQGGSTLVTIAKDTKIQIELNPVRVSSYRLIGYENRLMKDSEFNDDKKDAGDLGAGHTVTAIYELVLADREEAKAKIDPLKYQQERRLAVAADSSELMTVKLRYKEPTEKTSQLFDQVVSTLR